MQGACPRRCAPGRGPRRAGRVAVSGERVLQEHSPGVGTVLIGLLGNPGWPGLDCRLPEVAPTPAPPVPGVSDAHDRLAEAADDALLEKGQQAEERVGSVDYDVWKCGSCWHHFTLRYPKWFSSFAKCPQCHNRTSRPPRRSSSRRARPAAAARAPRRARSAASAGSTRRSSAHRVELLVVGRFVERDVQQFRRRQLGRRRSQ